jgi:phosphopantetheinyl transferase
MSVFDLEDCFTLMNEEERFHAERLEGAARRRFVVSRAFRRRILGPEAEILTEENGRPYVKGNPVFFSVSHTGNVIVMAVDSHPVGIDIEYMKARDFARLSSWFFKECIPDREAFYRRWTCFESGLKLAGLSLFSRAVCEPEYLHSEVLGDFMLSVASNHSIGLPLSITRPVGKE